MKEEIRQKLTGAVIGLARTCENNEKTENTNRVFLEAPVSYTHLTLPTT